MIIRDQEMREGRCDLRAPSRAVGRTHRGKKKVHKRERSTEQTFTGGGRHCTEKAPEHIALNISLRLTHARSTRGPLSLSLSPSRSLPRGPWANRGKHQKSKRLVCTHVHTRMITPFSSLSPSPQQSLSLSLSLGEGVNQILPQRSLSMALQGKGEGEVCATRREGKR